MWFRQYSTRTRRKSIPGDRLERPSYERLGERYLIAVVLQRFRLRQRPLCGALEERVVGFRADQLSLRDGDAPGNGSDAAEDEARVLDLPAGGSAQAQHGSHT